jgi:hypothetical protein
VEVNHLYVPIAVVPLMAKEAKMFTVVHATQMCITLLGWSHEELVLVARGELEIHGTDTP